MSSFSSPTITIRCRQQRRILVYLLLAVLSTRKTSANLISRFFDYSEEKAQIGDSCTRRRRLPIFRPFRNNEPQCEAGLSCLPRADICMPPLDCLGEAAQTAMESLTTTTLQTYIDNYGLPLRPSKIEWDGLFQLLSNFTDTTMDQYVNETNTQCFASNDNISVNGVLDIFPTIYAGVLFEFVGGFLPTAGIFGGGATVSVIRVQNKDNGRLFYVSICAGVEFMAGGKGGIGAGTVVGAASTLFPSDLKGRKSSLGVNGDGPSVVSTFPGATAHIALVPGLYGPRLLDLYFTSTASVGPAGSGIGFGKSDTSSSSSDDKGGIYGGVGFAGAGAGISYDQCFQIGAGSGGAASSSLILENLSDLGLL